MRQSDGGEIVGVLRSDNKRSDDKNNRNEREQEDDLPDPALVHFQACPATSIIEAATASLARLPPQITNWNAG